LMIADLKHQSVDLPDGILLGPIWQVEKEDPIKPFTPAKQVTSLQPSSRQSELISSRASGCSCDSIQSPVKQARTYSASC